MPFTKAVKKCHSGESSWAALLSSTEQLLVVRLAKLRLLLSVTAAETPQKKQNSDISKQ